MSRPWLRWAAIVVCCLAVGAPLAGSDQTWPNTQQEEAVWPRSYTDGATRKLGRAVANILTAPLELVRKPSLVRERDGGIASLTVGLAQGLKAMGIRMGAGFIELATFPLPFPDQRFQPLVEPEFVFSNGEWMRD